MKQFTAVKAFIINKGKILILRESSKYEEGTGAGKFDVPGGRVKPGEKFDESLLREIKEETGLDVKIGCAFHIDEWRPVVNDEQWQIIGTYIECFSDSSNIKLSDDHDRYEWINPEDYKDYELIGKTAKAFEIYLDMKNGKPKRSLG